MGVSITATNSKYDFDMGYGGFYSLRTEIAKALDPEFGENYAGLGSCFTKEEYVKNDRKANKIIAKKGLDKKYKDVLDFLYASDCGGKASYKTCQKILELIKNKNYRKNGFRYAAYSHEDYAEFKDFLQECVKNRRNMRWY